MTEDMTGAKETGWLGRLKAGLSRSSDKITGGITDLFTKRKLDRETLDELEEILITGDLGVATAGKLTQSLADSRFGKEITPDEVKDALSGGGDVEDQEIQLCFVETDVCQGVDRSHFRINKYSGPVS